MSGAPPFLSLDALLLPPPLPALVSVSLALGLAGLGRRLGQRLFPGGDAAEAAGGYVLVLGAFGAGLHGLALAGLYRLPLLRAIAGALAVAGLVEGLGFLRERARPLLEEARASFRESVGLERLGLGLGAVTLAAFALVALGPATDADSITYHLGAPLDWLARGGFAPREDFHPMRLVGLGEALNGLGLAAGTDGLGAALSMSGVALAFVALGSVTRSTADRRFVFLLVSSCPLLAFLSPSQKPMYLLAAANTLGFLLVVRRFGHFDARVAWVSFAALGLACASKFSFVLTGLPLLAALLASAFRARRLAAALGIGAACFAVLLAPVLVRNLVHYGDPISPLLERFRPSPDPAVVGYADYLRTYSGEATPLRVALLPLELVFRPSPAWLSTVLGVGCFSVFAVRGSGAPGRVLLAAAAAGSVLTVAFGQLTPRFFLEPYFWVGAAAVLAGDTVPRRRVVALLALQGGLVVAMALVGLVSIAPGALTAPLREQVRARAAAGYVESRWLDELLPKDAVLLAASGYPAFLPRPWVIADEFRYDLDPALAEERARRLVRSHRVTAAVLPGLPFPPLERLVVCAGRPLAPITGFTAATRNPFNRGTPYDLRVFALDPDAPCLAAPPSASVGPRETSE